MIDSEAVIATTSLLYSFMVCCYFCLNPAEKRYWTVPFLIYTTIVLWLMFFKYPGRLWYYFLATGLFGVSAPFLVDWMKSWKRNAE
jgi:hypothetical protein